jgi:hypothetical protein
VKIEHVEEQKLGSKSNLQKVKVKHVKEGDLNIRHTSSNRRLDLESKVPKIFGLLLDPKIHSSECCIKELQDN